MTGTTAAPGGTPPERDDGFGGTPAAPDGLQARSVEPDAVGAAAALELAARLDVLTGRVELMAARSEVLAARAGLAAETVRLEASVRSALDVPARVRRAPAKAAGVAAGAAFLLFGGPSRVVRGVRRAIFGPQADLPKSMLPDEIDRELRKLGDDGVRVRAVLEREFARFLEERSDLRRKRDVAGTLASLAGNVFQPASVRAGRRLAEELFHPDAPSWTEALRRARERAERSSGEERNPG